MGYVVTIRQRGGNEYILLAILWESRTPNQSRSVWYRPSRAYIAASPGAGIERKTPSAGLIFAAMLDPKRYGTRED